jgi:hypothetical protein
MFLYIRATLYITSIAVWTRYSSGCTETGKEEFQYRTASLSISLSVSYSAGPETGIPEVQGEAERS